MSPDEYVAAGWYEEYEATKFYGNLKPVFEIEDTGRGRRDQYSLNAGQRDMIGSALLVAARRLYKHQIMHATLVIDPQRKIVVRGWDQAANLYEKLTGNDFYAGLCGEEAKAHGYRSAKVGAKYTAGVDYKIQEIAGGYSCL
jgi:hypothetical protein